MLATASPMAVDEPTFVEKKPFGGPRNDRLRDWLVRLPFPFARVVETQRPADPCVGAPINVRRSLPRPARIEIDHRVEDLHGDPRIRDDRSAETHAGEIGDADLVWRCQGPQRSSPYTDEIEGAGLTELRKQPPYTLILRLY
jgi:hypothetical protein